MPRRIFLHLGPPKTGTTYLQQVLAANAEVLRGQGVALVGTIGEHHKAANELMGVSSRRGERVPRGSWEALSRKVRAVHGDVVLSCERYSMLGPEQAREVSATFPDSELSVVFTLRDATASLPGRWQERVKNGGTITWPALCARVELDARFLETMVRANRPLDAWEGVVPPERIHVVTVPGPDAPRTLLLERFCEVVGADMAAFATLTPTRANPSMDLVGTELLRRVNADETSTLSPHAHHSEIKRFLTDEVLAPRRTVLKPMLTVGAFAAARRHSEELVDRVRREGYQVVGDLADLTSAKPPSVEDHVAEVPTDELLAAAVESIAALSLRSHSWQRRFVELERSLRSRLLAASNVGLRRWRARRTRDQTPRSGP
jgi:hypothetical protein